MGTVILRDRVTVAVWLASVLAGCGRSGHSNDIETTDTIEIGEGGVGTTDMYRSANVPTQNHGADVVLDAGDRS